MKCLLTPDCSRADAVPATQRTSPDLCILFSSRPHPVSWIYLLSHDYSSPAKSGSPRFRAKCARPLSFVLGSESGSAGVRARVSWGQRQGQLGSEQGSAGVRDRVSWGQSQGQLGSEQGSAGVRARWGQSQGQLGSAKAREFIATVPQECTNLWLLLRLWRQQHAYNPYNSI